VTQGRSDEPERTCVARIEGLRMRLVEIETRASRTVCRPSTAVKSAAAVAASSAKVSQTVRVRTMPPAMVATSHIATAFEPCSER